MSESQDYLLLDDESRNDGEHPLACQHMLQGNKLLDRIQLTENTATRRDVLVLHDVLVFMCALHMSWDASADRL